MSSTAILLAAGSGSRMQGSVADKVLTPLHGIPVFIHSVRAFLEAEMVDHFTIVYRDEPQRQALSIALKAINLKGKAVSWALGGQQRQDSVTNALAVQAPSCAYVFIHDCARPLINVSALQALDAAVRRDGAAVLAHPVIDTIKRIPDSEQTEQVALEDLDRNRLWAMETPQAFRFDDIDTAYKYVREHRLQITDDTAAAATIGQATTLVHNPSPNPKITTPADLHYAEWLCQQNAE